MNNDNLRAKKNRLNLFNSQSQPLYVSDEEEVVFKCRFCGGSTIKAGKTLNGTQRFQCKKMQ